MTEPDSAETRVISWLAAFVWLLVDVLVNALAIALVPFEVGQGILLPFSLPLIAAANILIPKVLYAGAGVAWTRFAPAAIWLVMAVVAATPRAGGDILLPGNSYSQVISLLYLGVGAASAVIGVSIAKTDLRSFAPRRTTPASDDHRA